MRALIIDETLRRRVAQIREYSADHVYIVGETIVPGDDPGHVLIIPTGYRAVFSFTRTPSGFYRDLSVSVNKSGKYPNPAAAFVLAALFGFTGWDPADPQEPGKDWLLAKDVESDAIRVAQLIGK